MAEPTTIARQTAVSGQIEGAGDLSIRGYVDGDIELSETLTIAPEGRVDGTIRAREVVVEGSFEGEIVAEQRVVLTDTARAVADIDAPAVEMKDGARLRGDLSITAGSSTTTSTGSTSTSSRTAATTGSRSTTSTSSATSSRSSSPSSSDTGSTSSSRRTRSSSTSSPTTTTTTVVEETEPDEEADESTDESTGEQEPEQQSDQEETGEISEQKFREYREDFTVKELREKLRQRDLQVSGTKDELIERLLRNE